MLTVVSRTAARRQLGGARVLHPPLFFLLFETQRQRLSVSRYVSLSLCFGIRFRKETGIYSVECFCNGLGKIP